MSYSTETVMHLKFESVPLLNSVDGSLFSPFGGYGEIVTGQNGDGLQLDDDFFYVSSLGATTTAFSLGFWLKPEWLGVVTAPNGNTETFYQPVCSRAVFSYNSATKTTSALFLAFNVYEESRTDGKKQLHINIGTGFTLSSAAYTAGEYHYFWIAFSAAKQEAKIFVDLLEDTEAQPIGVLPSSIPNVQFSINRITPGRHYRIARNRGIIDDMVLFSTYKTNLIDMARAANLGAEYISDSDYEYIREIDQAIIFDDLSETQINGIYANKGNLYVARSDGKLLKGSRLLWQHRRNFNKKAELVGLKKIKTASDSIGIIEDGALKLQNETIRID